MEMEHTEKEKEPVMAASEELSREVKTLVSAQDLHSLKQLQLTILGRLQDSNAVLSHFNDFSENCFAEISGDISRNTRILKSMKSDLDYIFLKLRLCQVMNNLTSVVSGVLNGLHSTMAWQNLKKMPWDFLSVVAFTWCSSVIVSALV